MNICQEILGWAELDVNTLNELFENNNLGVEDVEHRVYDKADINSWLGAVLEEAGMRFMDKVLEYLEENGTEEEERERISDYEVLVHTNYMCSSFDCSLGDIDLTDYSEENLRYFIDREMGR
jgi:hypothetical protein